MATSKLIQIRSGFIEQLTGVPAMNPALYTDTLSLLAKVTRLGNDDAPSASPANLPATLVRIPSAHAGSSSSE